MLSSLKRFSKAEVAQQRLKIIEFYDQYGEQTTKEAFGVDRKLVFVWKKRSHSNKNSLSSLIPDSTGPKKARQSLVSMEVTKHIRQLREDHPRLGKEKIKPLLDAYCKQKGIDTVSEATIGRVIKKHNFFFQKAGRVYHNPDGAWAKKKVKRKKRDRIKKPPRPESFGYIEMDTIIRFVDGIKVYFLTAIDVKLKFAFSLPYAKLNSRNAVDFFKKLQFVYPIKITTVQTDNGLEFLANFDEYLKHLSCTTKLLQ